MERKLSERLWSILNDASESCALNSNQLCDIDAARSIVRAWEDAPEFIAQGNCMSIPRMGISPSAAAIRDELPIGWIGKRVKIVEVG
jgi:hypothetical protein